MKKNDVKIRLATPADAKELLEIYSYYVKNTAISFEWEVPSVQEFAGRIENTLRNFPYYVAEISEDDSAKILGYAYASPFKTRAAYDWAVETSIYVKKDARRLGIGKTLLEKLENTLKKQNILNVNACIAFTQKEDSHLSNDSFHFHQKMGYSLVGTFHQCGYKFNTWYDMIWMEKMIGCHESDQKKVIPFPKLLDLEN